MRTTLWLVMAWIACGASTMEAQPRAASLRARDPAAEVKALQFALEGFVATGDLASFSRRVSPDCSFVTGHGEVFTRDQYVAHLRSMNGKMVVADDRVDVRVFGASAVLTAHQRVTLVGNGVQTVRFSVLTRSFVLKDGNWLLTSSQSTPTVR